MESGEPDIEFKEKVEEFIEGKPHHWTRVLALSTALIAVLTAVVSSYAGGYANDAFLQKNNAIYYQGRATDQWAYYQAKGIKMNLATDFYETTKDVKLEQAAVRYSKEQEEIHKAAAEDENLANEANLESAQALAKHERMSLGALFGQISIAMAAMAALLKQKILWIGSLGLGIVTLGIFLFVLF